MEKPEGKVLFEQYQEKLTQELRLKKQLRQLEDERERLKSRLNSNGEKTDKHFGRKGHIEDLG
jgi:hypothetical protein